MIPEEGGWAGAALSAVLGIAWALDSWRKKNSDTNRQIRNDQNATDWQNSLVESNREKDKRIEELNKRSEDHWILLSEARHEIASAKFDAEMWKYKFEESERHRQQENEFARERMNIQDAALKSAQAELARLRDT